MPALNKRIAQFNSHTPPPEEMPVELLCRDKNGIYIPFPTPVAGMMRNGETLKRTKLSWPASLVGVRLRNARSLSHLKNGEGTDMTNPITMDK